MDIHIHIEGTIHIHVHNAGDPSAVIDQINQTMAGGVAKTEELKTAVDTAQGQTK